MPTAQDAASELGRSLPDGEVLLPALALQRGSMLHNIRRLQGFCDERGVWLAPHGKTTMVPEVFSQQLAAGAWAITVATVQQAAVCARFGVPRVLMANEPATSREVDVLAALLADPEGPELYAYVDDADVLARIGRALRDAGGDRPLRLLVELGYPSGRAGVRSPDRVIELAFAIERHGPALELAGVAGYEGLIPGSDPVERLGAVDRYLGELMRAAESLARRHGQPLLVSAGGSAFFDRVVDRFTERAIPGARLVLRSGTYVTHDHGFYDTWSPMRSSPDRRLPGPALRPALELWVAVVSRPEPELAILGFGRRHAGHDAGLPIPLGTAAPGVSGPLSPGHRITAMNDQHAYMRVPPASPLRPGHGVVLGISHPCTVFDKWRTVLEVDDDRSVTAVLHTHF